MLDNSSSEISEIHHYLVSLKRTEPAASSYFTENEFKLIRGIFLETYNYFEELIMAATPASPAPAGALHLCVEVLSKQALVGSYDNPVVPSFVLQILLASSVRSARIPSLRALKKQIVLAYKMLPTFKPVSRALKRHRRRERD
ncbi:hypothetical protein KM043_016614 [Ampulex compressa]|nr:hypothetical protein KM043_016614 [Ampulex compressa]